MAASIWTLLERFFTTPYSPQPTETAFLARAETQRQHEVDVTAALPDARESERLFGVPLARRGLQPVYLKVCNGSAAAVRLQFRLVDPRYFSPLEAAARCHFSILRRLSAFGFIGWLFSPLLLLIPLKLLTAQWANRRMDTLFQSLGFHRRPIAVGETVEGYVFATLDAGTKIVRVSLKPCSGQSLEALFSQAVGNDGKTVPRDSAREEDIDLTFSLTVPDITVDYEHQQLLERTRAANFEDCTVPQLIQRLSTCETVTTDRNSHGSGDPVNLVVIGSFASLLVSFLGRWDETEAITLASCWRTVRAFLLGTEYRYSPVSPLFLMGRSQDIALQRIRQSINVRIHLRLWLSTYRFQGQPVWIGQVSRDIGVRFTTKVWNLTTHRIDSDIDESRDFVLDDLLQAEHVVAAGFVRAASPTTPTTPRHNLTGDPYYTDGQRVVILLSEQRTQPQFVEWT